MDKKQAQERITQAESSTAEAQSDLKPQVDFIATGTGKETKGLPESLLLSHPERCIRIPMRPDSRSLNLANAVAVVTYEVLRQHDFPGLRLASDFL